tara:strand:+ start:648 stop:1259 length:612 start_codon:yes stop_codon:yes gene_type:complete
MHVQPYTSNKIVCGCDEAGRGALAGPVVAGAVILPKKFFHKKLHDSKKISKKTRNELAEFIKHESICWAIGSITPQEIDKVNILNASIKAMHIAIQNIIEKFKNKPDLLLIDGNKFKPYNNINYKCIIKGDSKYSSIAAASIIAKTQRDSIMKKLGEQYPEYNWCNNKGYPTKYHKIKIMSSGITKHHRKSFKLLDSQYSLQF